MNKSVYIAKPRQRYYKTLNNILLQVPNHALKDVYMLNYGTIRNMNSSYYTGFFINNFFYHIISSKHTWFFGHFLEYALLFLNDSMDEGNE